MTAEEIAIKLEPLCLYLEASLKEELSKQGHIATGTLLESIKVSVVNAAMGTTIEGRGSKYAQYVDRGGKWTTKRPPFDVLLAWIKVNGYATDKKAISMAWALQYNIFKNGLPQHEKEAKSGFVTRTLQGNKDKIFTDIQKTIGDFYMIGLDNIIRDVKERIYGNN